MQHFNEGDRVRVDTPNETDPDHEAFHGRTGTILYVTEDDAETGDPRDAVSYRVELQTGETMDFRWRDLRPAPD